MLPYCYFFLYVLKESYNKTSEGCINWINFSVSKDTICNVTLYCLLYFLHVHGTLQHQLEIDHQKIENRNPYQQAKESSYCPDTSPTAIPKILDIP